MFLKLPGKAGFSEWEWERGQLPMIETSYGTVSVFQLEKPHLLSSSFEVLVFNLHIPILSHFVLLLQ